MDRKHVNVVHISTVHDSKDIRIFQKECRSLAARGYNVSIIAASEKLVTVEGVSIIPLRGARFRPLRMSIVCFRAFLKALSLKSDIYHLHDPELLPWGQLLRLFRKRVVFDMHENLPASILHREWLPRILRRPLSRATSVFERLLLKGMPIVFAEKSYARVYPWVKTSTIVLNMPLVNEFRSITIPERNGPIVGYIGVVDPSRGSTILLDALRVLKGWGLPVGLELIGPIEPQHERELRDLIEAYGLEGVNIRGYMDSIRGWKLLARCSLGTALLAPLPNYVDSYPTKVFEYMALGLPVLASSFPLYKTIVEDLSCGYCVDAQNPIAVAEKIRVLIDQPLTSRMLGENGKKAVEEYFNWANEERKLNEFYETILAP